MKRKKRVKLLFELKVLAICGAAVFMSKGVIKFYADVRNDAGKEEETGDIQITEGSAVIELETVIMPEIEGNAVTERQPVKEDGECQSNIPIMDWDAEEAYLLEKIAMAEAEGEGVEGKALVMLVVLNRVLSDGFPDTIEEVIYQRTGNGGWQFSPIRIIHVTDNYLQEALSVVEANMPRILRIKSGEYQPDRCELCDCCRHNRVLTKPISIMDLTAGI